jgi:hypothetical protein
MKRKMKYLLSTLVIALVAVSVYTVYALNTDDINDIVALTETGKFTHGQVTNLGVHNTVLGDSGKLIYFNVETDLGYYVESITATYNGNPLDLGFEGATEQGAVFRVYETFDPNETTYNILVPEATYGENNPKIELNVKYSQKTPVNIKYYEFTSGDDDYENISKYDFDHETVLVENYRDGDIVLPDDCTSNGCLLKLEFEEETYEAFKTAAGEGDMISARAHDPETYDDYLITGNDACDDNEHVCYVAVNRNFRKLTQGDMMFGYNKLMLYSENHVGFKVSANIDNFNDILYETGSNEIGYSDTKLEETIELFYGTKKLYLDKTVPRELIYSGENNTGTLRDFDSVTGSGFGYVVDYGGDRATVTIDSYYQDKMTLELNLSKNGNNILGGPVKINLKRFAFAGNAGELLEVDEIGRNCGDNYNNNTCDQGRYYSTQYRGVLSAFYTADNASVVDLTSCHDDSESPSETNLVLSDDCRPAVARDKSFNPHAIALFYDYDDEIVKVKDFNLNKEIDRGGYTTKAIFNSKYSSKFSSILDTSGNPKTIANDYIYLGKFRGPKIEDIEYFDEHLGETIMYDLVLISKEEASEKGIAKIGIFLVNGEIEKDEIPALTYGIGEGRIMEIRGEN